jgi:tRNA A37 threonylcarbamoyladenosine synthetase subunit TsaC/SUA5/YrdC
LNAYEKIYEIKNRDYSKALAMLCLDFNYLQKNTKLTDKQINFLKEYKNPWTILIDKEKILDKKLLDFINKLSNSEIYQKIAFRVSHNFIQGKLCSKY